MSCHQSPPEGVRARRSARPWVGRARSPAGQGKGEGQRAVTKPVRPVNKGSCRSWGWDCGRKALAFPWSPPKAPSVTRGLDSSFRAAGPVTRREAPWRRRDRGAFRRGWRAGPSRVDRVACPRGVILSGGWRAARNPELARHRGFPPFSGWGKSSKVPGGLVTGKLGGVPGARGNSPGRQGKGAGLQAFSQRAKERRKRGGQLKPAGAHFSGTGGQFFLDPPHQGILGPTWGGAPVGAHGDNFEDSGQSKNSAGAHSAEKGGTRGPRVGVHTEETALGDKGAAVGEKGDPTRQRKTHAGDWGDLTHPPRRKFSGGK